MIKNKDILLVSGELRTDSFVYYMVQCLVDIIQKL